MADTPSGTVGRRFAPHPALRATRFILGDTLQVLVSLAQRRVTRW